MSDQNLFQIDQTLLSFPSIDEVKIQEVISYDPSRDLLTELVEIFDVEMKDKIVLIKQTYETNQYSEVSKLAHRIRSTSLNLGATRLSEILKRIEYMTLETEVIRTEIDFLINALEKEFLTASEKLHGYVGNRG